MFVKCTNIIIVILIACAILLQYVVMLNRTIIKIGNWIRKIIYI